jgi:hypothetical protein
LDNIGGNRRKIAAGLRLDGQKFIQNREHFAEQRNLALIREPREAELVNRADGDGERHNGAVGKPRSQKGAAEFGQDQRPGRGLENE